MPKQGLSNMFLHIAAFSHLGALDSSLALCLEANEITNQEHKNAKR